MKQMRKRFAALCIGLSVLCCSCTTANHISQEYQLFGAETLTENGFLYSDDGVVTKYLDLESMEIVPYCSYANCIHNDSSCQARRFGGTEYGPILYGNGIYYFSEAEENWLDKDQDGREETPVIKDSLLCYDLENDMTKTVAVWNGTAGCCYNGACIWNDVLYFIGVHPYTEFSDLPGLQTPETIPLEYRLYGYDLHTGKLKEYGSLYDADLQYSGAAATRSLMLRGVSDGGLYFMYSYLEDAEKEDTMENETHLCIRFDLEQERAIVVSEPAPELVSEGYRCYTEKDQAVVRKGEKTWRFPAMEYGFQSRQLTLVGDKVWCISEETAWYYDLLTQEKTTLSVPEGCGESPCVIAIKGDSSYIIRSIENGVSIFQAVSS